jgi:hypothetical protein
MVDLARHLRVTALLEEIAEVEDRLIANEREMVAHLREKYADPGHSDGDDAAVLEIILRNVAIRRGFDIDPKTHTPLAFEAKTTN